MTNIRGKITLLICLVLSIVMLFALSSCGGDEPPANDDSQNSTQTGTNTDTSTDTSGDSSLTPDTPIDCIIEEAEGFEFDTTGTTPKIYKNVSNTTDIIDLSGSITVTKGCTWRMYKDFLGEEEYRLKSMSLSIGENKAYIVVYHPNGENFTRYELVLYRLDMKDYSFTTDNAPYEDGTIEELSSLESPATNPQKVGYDFKGWTVDGEIVSFPYQVNADTIFEAEFTPIEYQINYILNGGENNAENPPKYTIEQGVSLLEPTREYYEFAGWYENAECSGDLVNEISLGAYGNKSFYAKWTPITYNITYELNGGTNNEKNPSTYDTENGFVLGAPTKAGYNFVGWYSDADFTVENSEISLGEGNDITFYAKWEANINTIIFDVNGGSGSMPNMTIATDNTVNLTDNVFVKDGYTFKGWATSSNGAVAYADEASYTMGTEKSYTLYAVWEANKNTLVFNANGGNGSMSNMTISTDSQAKLTSNAFERAGYTFMGWSASESGSVDYTDGASYTMGANSTYTLYAVWQVNINGVTFNANGGKGTMSSLELATGVTDTLPKNTFTKDGYTFKGWATTNGGSVAYADGASYTMGTNSTYVLYAVWEANKNTLVFDSNGGSGSMGAMIIATDSTVTLTTNAFTKAGYTFKGWATSKGGNVVYTDGATYTMGTDSTYTLYAVWEANKNTLVFNANGGSGSMSNMTISTDSQATLTNNTFARDGYTFLGWSTTKNGSVVYADRASYTMGTESTYTLYAVWEANKNIIVFDGNGATSGIMSNMTLSTDSTANLTINTYTKNGCYFIGWATSPNGSVVYANGASYTMGANSIYTLYAVWESYCVTVEFDSNGGTEVEAQQVELNKKAKEPTTPIRDGYTFDGWYLGNDKWSFIGYVVSEDMTLVAKWIPNNNTVVFDANGGSGTMENMTVSTDSEVNLTVNSFIKAGYSFIGWSTTVDGQVEYADGANYFMGTNPSYTLYAIWQANENTLAFNGNGATGGSTSSMTIATDDTAVLTQNGFVRDGYRFVGWSTSANGSVEYTDKASYTMSTNRSYTLYAVWEANQNTLVFDANGGVGTMENMTIATDSTVWLNTNNFTKDYYTFKGWATSENGNVVYTNGARYVMGANNTYTLYAVWELTEYNITYVLNGGTNSWQNPSTYNVEEAITLASPARKGYSFKGWFTESNFENEITSISFGSSGKKTLYAKWEIIEYTITYNKDGGEEGTANPTTFTVEDLPVTINDLNNKTDYLFNYWYKESDFSGTPVEKITEVGNIELFASYINGTDGLVFKNNYGEWEINNYTGNSTKVVIPDNYKGKSVTSIGTYAFGGCSSIIGVTIPDSVTSIEDRVFRNCTSLTSVTIGDSVTTIGNDAFDGCTALTSVNYFGMIEEWCNISFGISANPLCNGASLYLNGEIVNDLVIPNTVTGIKNYAFSGCTALTSVTIPDSVTSIGSHAFYKCTSLERVTIPNSVTVIGNSVFRGCESLTSVTIGDSATTIGEFAFSGCTALTSVTIPDSVTLISGAAFRDCTSLTSVTIPDSVTSIEGSAFYGCTSLTSVIIPDSITSIGGYAFYNCTSLTSVTIPDSVTTIKDDAFYRCSKLTIYCEATEQPSGWGSNWNHSNRPVVWGHTHSYTDGQCVCGTKEN